MYGLPQKAQYPKRKILKEKGLTYCNTPSHLGVNILLYRDYITGKGDLQMDRIPFMLRLPEELHKKLKEEAKEKGVSLNELICYRLDRPQDTVSGRIQSPC